MCLALRFAGEFICLALCFSFIRTDGFLGLLSDGLCRFTISTSFWRLCTAEGFMMPNKNATGAAPSASVEPGQ
jgi:hypothetical protein